MKLDEARDIQLEEAQPASLTPQSAQPTFSPQRTQANDVGLSVAFDLRRGGFHLHAAFSAPPGMTALLGRSGAGKSLTLQAIAGLTHISHGSIVLNGVALVDTAQRRAIPARRRRIGYVPQAYALFPHLTVAQNIAYGLPQEQGGYRWQGWLHPGMRERRDQRIAELLRLVRLPGFERRRPAQLSGGEAQRVALARALAAEPAALLLDEPLSALDASTREAIRDDLRAIIAASGIPTLLVTHDLGEARALAERVVALCAGHVVAEGSLGATLASPPTTTAARLFGWENILPVQSAERLDANARRVTLSDGQALIVTGMATPTASERVALALRAEWLEIQAGETRAGKPDPEDGNARLYGCVRYATDAGAYVRVRVALGNTIKGADQEPCVTLLCSPREWMTLGLEPGAPVAVRIPNAAARLVAVDD